MCTLKPQKKSKQGSEAFLNLVLLHGAEQGKASQNHINKVSSDNNIGKTKDKEQKTLCFQRAPHQVNEKCLVKALSANMI